MNRQSFIVMIFIDIIYITCHPLAFLKNFIHKSIFIIFKALIILYFKTIILIIILIMFYNLNFQNKK